MKYILRGITIFEYNPMLERDKVKEHRTDGGGSAFTCCNMIDENYKLLGEFFTTVYRHSQGEDVELKDIEVY